MIKEISKSILKIYCMLAPFIFFILIFVQDEFIYGILFGSLFIGYIYYLLTIIESDTWLWNPYKEY